MFNVQTLVKTGDRPDRRKVFYSNIWRFIIVHAIVSTVNTKVDRQ